MKLILTYTPVPPSDVRAPLWGVLVLPALFVIGAFWSVVL